MPVSFDSLDTCIFLWDTINTVNEMRDFRHAGTFRKTKTQDHYAFQKFPFMFHFTDPLISSLRGEAIASAIKGVCKTSSHLGGAIELGSIQRLHALGLRFLRE